MQLRGKENISPTLKALHWLPVNQRIFYKIALYVFKAIHGKAPSFIADMIDIYSPNRSLRSQEQLQLAYPKQKPKLKYYGMRAFPYAAFSAWNSLPISVRSCCSIDSFKKALKTYLF